MLTLRGVGVLVTRPEQQARALCRLLEGQGASTLRFPVIEISGLGDWRQVAARLGALDDFDLIIFTSANAVRFGAGLLNQERALTLAAIGPATARALNHAGYRVAVQPSAGFDSENLLNSPWLENMAGRRVLLVKGRGGRALLERELMRRGAEVVIADVYERVPVRPSDAALAELLEHFDAGAVQVIAATSLEIATRLLDLAASAALRAGFERVHWLLPGDRIAAGVRARGLSAPLLRADSAEAHDLVTALVRWRVSASGA
ncbi:MAG: uroporphyrinogen-III synthase [Pseudomonadota bacterium]|nr:uroporphyrinogen-III synthase [Pseudomonadota bacterium]